MTKEERHPMKLFARQAIAASLFCAVASASTAFAQQPFTSRNEPLTPAMASRGEMDAFRTDLDVYVKNIDREIEKLLIQRKNAIQKYNKTARKYNDETFFHQDKVPYYSYHFHDRRRHGNDCWNKERTKENKDKTHEQRMNERIEHFIDGMMDW